MRDEIDRREASWSRREWLLGTLLIGLGQTARGKAPDKPDEELARTLKPVLERAKALNLRGFRGSTTEHYVGVGDSQDQFRKDALAICEQLASVYKKVFVPKGFPVEFPTNRMTVVVLRDRESYATYLGETPGKEVGGHYDLDTNQLVMFDFRGDPAEQAPNARRLNEFTLVHEALHQLNYNTGLLHRGSDVPDAVSEGLAMYGEYWQHKNKQATLGVVNHDRLAVFRDHAEDEVSWFPVEELLTNDSLFDGADAQLAYAESWVFVHYLIKTSTMLPKFRFYLKSMQERSGSERRLQDARKYLGDLAALNRNLRKYALSKLRG